MDHDLFGSFVMALLAAGGVYGAVKANLTSAMKSLERLEKNFDEHLRDHATKVMR